MSFRGLNYESLDDRIIDLEQLTKGVRENIQTEILAYENKLNAEIEVHPVDLETQRPKEPLPVAGSEEIPRPK